ncbi:MAG: amidohydrolase family protein [Actinomycetota bacterium]
MVLLRSATLADGTEVDVRIDGAFIAATGPPGSLKPALDEEGHDLEGYVLLPAPADPHAHLDKAFTSARVESPRRDLPGAVDAWMAFRSGLDAVDVLDRARAAAFQALARGVTAIRSHVDVGQGIELRGAEALIGLREELAGLLHIDLVALVSRPLTGLAGADNRALLRAAMELGVDLVGGAPHVDDDPRGALEICLETASDLGRPVDLHMDETLDPAVLGLEDLAQMVAQGFPHPVTASHCVSLGVQPREVQGRVAQAVAAAGIAVVACPQTNLYLQGRDWENSPPRGLTALRPLLDAGVTVGAGGDNVQDVFNPLGRGDPLETAGLLVSAGHLSCEEAYDLVSRGARGVMGLPAVEVVAPGRPADLLAVAGHSLPQAIATATEDRWVFAAGRTVARTRVERRVAVPTEAGTAAAVGGSSWR